MNSNATVLEKRIRSSPTIKLLIAVAFSLFSGLIFSFLPSKARIFSVNQILIPLTDTFTGLISAVAGPMIFLSVVCGICGVGDTAMLGKIGRKMISRFLLMNLFLAILVLFIFLPFFNISPSSEEAFDFTSIISLITDIIPKNLFTPFTENNPLQIIFISIVTGFAVSNLSETSKEISQLAASLNSIIQLIMRFIIKLLPIFVYLILLQTFLSENITLIIRSYKMLLLSLLGCIFCIIYYLVVLAAKKKVSPLVFISKALPTFLIGITTASSVAAFITNSDTCEKDLGIDRDIVDFGIPVGQIVFTPGFNVIFFAISLCSAENFGTPITPIWLITCFLIVFILSIAAPPVPGGSLTCFTVLFLQLGIPEEALGVAIALNIFLDFIATSSNLFCLQAELCLLADSLSVLSIDTLRNKI